MTFGNIVEMQTLEKGTLAYEIVNNAKENKDGTTYNRLLSTL